MELPSTTYLSNTAGSASVEKEKKEKKRFPLKLSTLCFPRDTEILLAFGKPVFGKSPKVPGASCYKRDDSDASEKSTGCRVSLRGT